MMLHQEGVYRLAERDLLWLLSPYDAEGAAYNAMGVRCARNVS
jgi:hypothetical protein